MTNKLKKTFVYLLMAVLICTVVAGLSLSFAIGDIGVARAEDLSVTIYTNGDGSVSSGEQNSTTDAGNSINVSVTEEGLTVKATPAEGFIFRNWTTDAAGSKAVSMKIEDSFTYEEVQALSGAVLYANFTASIEEQREEAKLTINYDERLGDIYLFTDNKDVTEEQLKLHGLKIKSDDPFEVAYTTKNSRSPQASDVVIGAIAKTEVQSTMDASKTTSAVFENWAATYKPKEVDITDRLPERCTSGGSMNETNGWGDGNDKWTPGNHNPVGNIWWSNYVSRGSEYTSFRAGYYNNNSNNKYSWWTNPYEHSTQSIESLSIKNNSIKAIFAEVAAAPTMNITPTVDEIQRDQVKMDGTEAFITMPYGKDNSVNVLIPMFDGEGLTEQNYNVSLKKGIKLGNGEEIVESVQVSPVSDDILGFSILNIETNCTVVITPSYKSETVYVVQQFTIYINLESENGLQDIVSAESEEITASDLPEGIDWRLDSQYNSNALAFSSGLTYPENITQNEASQMHFQVKGSGVFTFEMYLDGMFSTLLSAGYSYAVCGLNSPVDSSKVNGKTTSFSGDTTLLATGYTDYDFFAGAVYEACKINATENVSRMMDSDWCNVSINIKDKSDDETTDIYIAHIVTSYNTTNEANLDIYRPHTVMIVRNVAFYQGMSDVKWDIYDNEKGDKTGYGEIIAKTNGEEAKQGNTDSGTKIDFDIEFDNGLYKFYGWSDGNELLSTQQDFTYTVKGSSNGESKTNIYAVLSTNEERYVYRFGGKFYDVKNLQQALSDAEASTSGAGNIYILESLTLSNETLSDDSLTIPKNVNLIIPFDETYRLHGSDADGDETIADIAWRLPEKETQFKHIVITIDNITVNINGGLYLGGVVNNQSHNYQGHTSGAYSQIVNDGTIIVGEGGVFDVYGRVTGNGKVEVQNKGSLYQPFLILDYSGGTDALGLFMSGLTPFRRYSMINIECPITVNYGGVLYGHASLYALSSYFSLDQPFISYDMGSNLGGDGKGHDTFITLSSDSKVEITYDSNGEVGNATTTNGTAGIGKTKLVFTGGAKFSYMLFTAAGISVPTNSVYFSIPYNFEVELNGEEAQYEVKTDFKLMPGSKITIGEGATLTCNANLNILDGIVQGALHDKSYPKAADLKEANYSQSGNLIVNGKLIIGKKTPVPPLDLFSAPSPDFDYTPKPATLLGIIQTNGTKGSIQIEADTIVSGKIIDGSASNYFEYTTSARVWDAVHGCFAQLEAGKTYTATSGDAFTLDKLNYASTNGGAQTSVLQLDQSMHGSWKLADHDENSQHVLDWTPKAEDGYDKLGKGNTHVTIHRQCNVLGCSHKEDRELLFKVDSLGNVVYTGSEITEDEFKQLFKLMFGVEGLEEHAEFAFDPKTNVGEYDLTITLDSNFAYWYNGNAEAYAESYQLKYHIVKKGVTVEILDQHVTYNGAEQSAGSVANKDWQLKEGSSIAPKEDLSVLGVKLEARGTDANSYDITLSANTSNYNVKFEYKGSVAESVAKNAFVIDKANIKIKANDLESAQDDALLDVSAAGYTFLEDTHFFSAEDKQLFDSNLAYACEGLSNATVAEYDIVITIQDGFTMQNYNLEAPVNGTYYVRDSIFKDVKVTLDGNESLTVTFDGRYHKLAVTGLAPEIQAAATISYKYQGADMPTEGFRNANEYPVEISIKVAGHSNEYTATHTLKIEAAPITIKILPQTKVYDGKNAVLAQDKWEKTDGNWVDGTTPEDIIALKFEEAASVKNFGKYDIVVECSDSNYKVNFTDGTEAYSIEKAPLTVTAHDQRSTYGENPVTVGSNGTYTIDGWLEEAALDVNVSHTVTNTTPWKEGGYEITVSVPAQTNPALGNYDLHEVNGTYTVDKRNVTVNIKDQNDVFEFGKTYSFDLTAWELDASTPLANGEQSSVLHIALARPTFDGAGKYAITATYSNDNYNVTFEGNWATEDENEGKAGTYTIDKKTLTDDSVNVIFMLIIGDEDESHEDKLSVIFNGDPIALDALVYVTENSAPKSLAFTISPAQLTEVKEYSVTVTIDDKNYAGSRTFTVEVLTAEGYSQTLSDALKQLKEIVGDLTADTLTSSEEHFDIIKRVKAILDGLSEEDKTAGAEQLAKYEELVETWETAADISDDVIDTAKDIADLPIKWLFAMAEMSILLAAMYVIGKGGLM